MNAPRDASFDDYMDAVLKDPAEAAAYIDAMLELGDPAVIRNVMERTLKAQTELLDLIGEAYQVVGILADECGRFDDPHVIKMMEIFIKGVIRRTTLRTNPNQLSRNIKNRLTSTLTSGTQEKSLLSFE